MEPQVSQNIIRLQKRYDGALGASFRETKPAGGRRREIMEDGSLPFVPKQVNIHIQKIKVAEQNV